MDGLHLRRRRARPFLTRRRAERQALIRQLADDPAVQVAASAAYRGLGDFLDILALPPRDFDLVEAGLEALAKLMRERNAKQPQ